MWDIINFTDARRPSNIEIDQIVRSISFDNLFFIVEPATDGGKKNENEKNRSGSSKVNTFDVEIDRSQLIRYRSL